MKSLHVTLKEPPNPKPISTIGIFNFNYRLAMIEAIKEFLDSHPYTDDPAFTQNVREEAIAAINKGVVIATSRVGTILTVTIQEKR